jgi:hypothetical protein
MQLAMAGMKLPATGTNLTALSATAVKQVPWSTNAGVAAQFGADTEGDPAIVPDPANDRLKMKVVGNYYITVSLSGLLSAAANVYFQLRKNGTTLIPEAIASVNANAIRFNATIAFLLSLSTTDVPTGGLLATYADPNDPAPNFVGGGGFPKTLTTLELMAFSDGTPNCTIETANFQALKLE